ncbi:M48 family metallopeptidase [Motilimonas sp. KMU-193]|uniref:M48 family metallopeptidase n=1 Tax=Motilimonas sp. KMU-193 TaxID=3388668 RepID=UPI00396B0FF1
MISISGHYYSGKNSKATPCCLRLQGDKQVEITQVGLYFDLTQLRIPARIGSGNRWIYFPDGSSFESTDSDAVDKVKQAQPSFSLNLHKFESRFRYIIPSLVLTVAFVIAFAKWGIPATTYWIAEALPEQTSSLIGNQSLEWVEGSLFEPSSLSQEKQDAVHKLFQPYLKPHHQVLIRHSEALGPNAFALPNGTLVFTDAIIELTNDQELLAILGHELGHVDHKHGLQQMIRSSLILFLYMMVTGDAAGASSTVTAIPAYLLEQGYSREFEREADDYAIAFLQKHQLPTTALASALNKLYQSHGISIGQQQDQETKIYDYLSSHPAPPQRLERLNETP